MYSVVVPIYRNAEFVPLLIAEFSRIAALVAERFGMPMEVVFVASREDATRLLKAVESAGLSLFHYMMPAESGTT